MYTLTNPLKQDDYCSYCKKITFLVDDHREGNVTCQSCGLVTERIIDQTTEYRQFSADEKGAGVDRQRLGGIRDDTREDGGLSLGVHASSSGRASSVLKMNMRLGAQSEDMSLIRGQALIREWCGLLNLKAATLMTAKEQFCKIESKISTFRGRSLESVIAAVLLIATRIRKIPLKPHDIVSVTQVPMEDMHSAFNAMKGFADDVPSVDSLNYCSNFCVKMEVPHTLSALAYKIAEDIHENRYLDGKNPRTVAAVAIYIASLELSAQKTCSLKAISERAEIGEATIKKTCKDVYAKYQGKFKN